MYIYIQLGYKRRPHTITIAHCVVSQFQSHDGIAINKLRVNVTAYCLKCGFNRENPLKCTYNKYILYVRRLVIFFHTLHFIFNRFGISNGHFKLCKRLSFNQFPFLPWQINYEIYMYIHIINGLVVRQTDTNIMCIDINNVIVTLSKCIYRRRVENT